MPPLRNGLQTQDRGVDKVTITKKCHVLHVLLMELAKPHPCDKCGKNPENGAEKPQNRP
ncbi:hypothetical protein FB480_111105 [Agrobacterium vitis]|nr:hypothetical protein FB480_111105 [Agrobacterium vitis]